MNERGGTSMPLWVAGPELPAGKSADGAGKVPDYLDRQALGELRELLGDDMDEIVACFIDQLVLMLEQVERALDDADHLRRSARTLKGSAGNLGAVLLAERAGRIEKAAAGGDLAAAAGLVSGLRELSDATIAALQAPNRAA